MKIIVTVLTTKQIGFETFKDIPVSRLFHDRSTIDQIITWVKTVNKDANISTITFGEVSEEKE